MMHIRSAFIRLATLGLDGCPLDIISTYPVVRRGYRSGPARHVSTEMRTCLGEINRVDSGTGHFLRFFQRSMDGGCGLAEVYNFPLAHAFISTTGHPHNAERSGLADLSDQGLGPRCSDFNCSDNLTHNGKVVSCLGYLKVLQRPNGRGIG